MKGLIINKIILLSVIISSIFCIINLVNDTNKESSLSFVIVLFSLIYVIFHIVHSSENEGYILKIKYKYIKFENNKYGRYFTTSTNNKNNITISLYKDRLYPKHIQDYDWHKGIKGDLIYTLNRIKDKKIEDDINISSSKSEYENWTGSLTSIDDREDKMKDLLGK